MGEWFSRYTWPGLKIVIVPHAHTSSTTTPLLQEHFVVGAEGLSIGAILLVGNIRLVN